MRPPRLLLLLVAACAFFAGGLRAEEPFFKKGEVIAIVGGEDMVALSEYGYLELLLTRALPDYHLRFRNLAWEGDTVFEQRRDLNFPTWEEALEKIGATVVLCQFGQMESLGKGEERKAKGDGAQELEAEAAEFRDVYKKLISRFSGGGKRRVVCVGPVRCGGLSEEYNASPEGVRAVEYYRAAQSAARATGAQWVTLGLYWKDTMSRDGFHLNARGQFQMAGDIVHCLGLEVANKEAWIAADTGAAGFGKGASRRNGEPLRQLIIAKNRLWFDYWRVQNWAFLAGDRTNQPSSREHLDPTRRWFPEEREKFLPLIEAKEREIDALAAQLAQP